MSKVSFIIPIKNSKRTLDKCIYSIANQDYSDFEIIIIDNMSTDGSDKIARKYTDKVYYCNGTLGECRQLGFEKSCGEIIAIFDSDIILPNTKWLKRAVARFTDNTISTVQVPQVPAPSANIFSKFYVNYNWFLVQERFRKKKGIVGGGNCLFRRSSIEEVGGIDVPIHWIEDIYLARKLMDAGFSVVLHDEPIYHDTHVTLGEILVKELSRVSQYKKMDIQWLHAMAKSQLFYEQVVTGLRGMLKGLFKDKECSWSLYPLFILIRLLAYTTMLIR